MADPVPVLKAGGDEEARLRTGGSQYPQYDTMQAQHEGYDQPLQQATSPTDDTMSIGK